MSIPRISAGILFHWILNSLGGFWLTVRLDVFLLIWPLSREMSLFSSVSRDGEKVDHLFLRSG